jgi:osmoprotectant transport system substrate-binding protein
MGTRSRATTKIVALAIAVTAVLAACGPAPTKAPQPSNGTSVTIGSQGTLENQIIAQLYGQALSYKGYDVKYNPGIGTRKQYLKALTEGLIDFIPEYSGSLLAGLDSSSRLTETSSMLSIYPNLLEKRELMVLEPAPADNGYALVVTKRIAEQATIVNIGDLASIGASISIGATPEFEGLPYGRAGLLSTYGVSGWVFVPIEDETGEVLVDALLDDDIQVAGVHASAPAILRDDLVVLGDPSKIIAAQNVLPLIRNDLYTPDLAQVVNAVSEKLTTKDLRELNALATAKSHPTPESIARNWLQDHGFLG